MNNDWTPSRVETLTTMWVAGKSASEIAAELGDGITRNAVIGKISRLKLTRDAPPAKPKLKPIEVSAPVVPVASERREKFVTPAVLRPIKVEEFVEIPPTDRVALVDLQAHHCRWPIGDPTSPHFGFCGARRAEPNNPFNQYCGSHGAIAYVPSRNKKAMTPQHKAKLLAGRAKAKNRQWGASK